MRMRNIALPGFHQWSSIEQAWAATEHCPVASINDTISATPKRDNSWALIKREARVRLLVLDPEAPQQRTICKIYRIPPHLGWRTLGMVSRANREFTALMEAHRKGLPVACPHSWREARTFGFLTYSSISLELIAGTTLEDLLGRESVKDDERLQLAWQNGQLLRRLHKAGLQWGTAFPRNIIVQDAPPSVALEPEPPTRTMRVIDTPYAVWHTTDISGSHAAIGDLQRAAKVKNDGVGFTGPERTQMVLGYCDDDIDDHSSVLEQLEPRPKKAVKMERWRSRMINVLAHSPRSKGAGGHYDETTGEYHPFN